jgi:hypothetical protein
VKVTCLPELPPICPANCASSISTYERVAKFNKTANLAWILNPFEGIVDQEEIGQL